jgi:hypothetical protein
MALSSIQQGLIAQYEYAKFLMLGSGGLLELAAPMTDDERRDYEIHRRGRYGVGLANQVKSSTHLHRMSKNVRYLYIHFDVRADRLVSSPFFWYFFAFLDPKLMGLADPTYLVPSKDFHQMAAPKLRNGVWTFTMAASMEPKARDKWHPYRVKTLDLGQKMLDIMADLKRRRVPVDQAVALLSMPEALRVVRRSS